MIEPDDAFWKRKQAKNLKRRVGIRKPRDVFLIVCEGAKTEPNYFIEFRLSSSYVKNIFGIGDNTERLVQRAIEFRNDAARYGIKYDQIWCVFDKNSFPITNFNNAIALADRENIKVAYSNEAFELWYLLHFNYICTAMDRNEYINKLSVELDEKYEKNSETIYQKLLNKQENAIKNAKRLLSTYSTPNPYKDNPSTTVHILVEELNKFLK
jgi:hypothetical protein